MYVYAGVAPGYLVVFFPQMNILSLPDASVNREEVYEEKSKSTTFFFFFFPRGVHAVITCARVNDVVVFRFKRKKVK